MKILSSFALDPSIIIIKQLNQRFVCRTSTSLSRSVHCLRCFSPSSTFLISTLQHHRPSQLNINSQLAVFGMSFDEFTGLPLSAMDPDKPFDEWTGLPLPAMDLDNSTRQPGLTDEVMRLALLSKTQRQAELASKQAAFNQAVSQSNITLRLSLTKLSSNPAPLPMTRQCSWPSLLPSCKLSRAQMRRAHRVVSTLLVEESFPLRLESADEYRTGGSTSPTSSAMPPRKQPSRMYT